MANNSQPKYMRQRFLLSFIRELESEATKTDLQKLVFLHMMSAHSDYYDFVPYKFGAYSFQLDEDLDILQRDGFITPSDGRIQATNEMRLFRSFDIAIERGDNLKRKAYRAYPYYTINSEIVERLFECDLGTRDNLLNERNKYAQTEQALFTIGYEGRSVESFMNVLLVNGVRLLCDVRSNPFSRKFGFSKERLKHITETVGIKYEHYPELGIESDKRTSLESAEDYSVLFDEYKVALPKQRRALNKLYSKLSEDSRVALMCFEKDAAMCHRHVIRDYFTSEFDTRSEDL